MDASLIQMYRLVLDDCVLLYDVFNITTHSIRGLPSMREYADAVAAVIHVESQMKKTQLGLEADGNDSVQSTIMSNREFAAQRQPINIIWEYVHGVLMPFVVEELSQYPFWAAKAYILTDDSLLDAVKDVPFSAIFSSHSLASRFFSRIVNKFAEHGLLSLFEGSLSYMAVGTYL
jgi:hypothetical protein